MSLFNAPEMKGESKADGEKSKVFLRELLEGQEVILKSHEKDVFGRWLSTVYFGGVNVNEKMLADGRAKVYHAK